MNQSPLALRIGGQMKILITGGAGYVGGHLVDRLIADGHEVIVFDSLFYEDQYLKPIKFVFGDIRDADKLLELIHGVDLVIWLAALVGDPACAIDPELTEEINTHSLKPFLQNYSGKLIFISTCSVYGAQDVLLDENSEVNPLSVYAATKLQTEILLKNRPLTWILRLGTLFGISDAWSRIRLDLAVNVLTQKALMDKKLEMFGGDQWRPFLHVKDVGNTIALNLENFPQGVYNLASSNITITDLVHEIASKFSEIEIVKTNLSFQDSRNYRVSTAKAKKDLILPEFLTIEDGILEIKSALNDGRIPNPNSVRFKNASVLKDKWSSN